MSKLFRAASAGKLTKLKQVLKANPALLNQCNRDGYTALSIAISYQQYDIIEYLLNEDGIDVNAGHNDITPMFVAMNTNNQDIAVQLLDHGADPNTLCTNNTAIIHYAIQSVYWRLIQKLFSNASFNYKIMTHNLENIFHIIVDIENDKLLMDIIRLMENKEDIKEMMNALDNMGHTPLWKAIKQNELNITQIILNTELGNADINCICNDNQTVSHLVYELYPLKDGPFHELLNEYNADLSIMDIHGRTALDIGQMIQQKEVEHDLEEQLLMEETMKLREKLKKSRIQKSAKKHDKVLNIWLNGHNLRNTSFSDALLHRNIKWKQFMIMNDDEIYEIIEKYCNNMDDERIQYVLNEWNNSKTEYKTNKIEKKKKKKKSIKKQEKKEEIVVKKESKFVCNKYVKQFLMEYGLLELEFIFAKENIDMTKLSEINNIWINKHILGDSNHVNNLKMRLKLAIIALRKEIVREMRLKIKSDYQEKYGDKTKHKMKNNLRKKLRAIHPVLAKLEEILSDPLYLLSFGFFIFVLFTFVLFVIVGPQNESAST